MLPNIGANIGESYFVKEEMLPRKRNVLGPNAILLRSKDNDNYFLYNIFNRAVFIQNINDISGASGQPKFNKTDLKTIRINVPDVAEQEKIARFLSAVDDKIATLGQKVELLKKYKKGAMQSLFTQKIRFSDNSGGYPAWRDVQLSKLLHSFKLGGNYENTEIATENPLMKMGNLGRGRFNLNKIEYITQTQDINSDDKMKYNDLFFNTRNTLDLVGKVSIWKNELPLAFYNSNLMLLDFECNPFMNYYFNSNEGLKKLKRLATGTTSVAAIYTRDLLRMYVNVPSDTKEQQKIADFLTALDEKIQLEESKLEQAKNFKKALLQQMFV